MTQKSNLSQIMKMAWNMFKSAKVETFAEALRKAWAAAKAKALMAAHKVRFQFVKADGTVRTALGTLKVDGVYEYKGNGNRKPSFSAVAYYDLEKMSFRSFSVSNFIGVTEVLD